MTYLRSSHSGYPAGLAECLRDEAPQVTAVLGEPDILQSRKLALFCSSRCPGSLILQTHELVQNLGQSTVTIVSGFHSPVEQECLILLLRQRSPIVYCLARALDGMRIRKEYREPLQEGRLVFLSPFLWKPRRATAETALYRNRVAAAMADTVLIIHAAPGGKTEELCHEVLFWGKPLLTLSSDHNDNLIALGARAVSPDTVGTIIEAAPTAVAGTDAETPRVGAER